LAPSAGNRRGRQRNDGERARDRGVDRRPCAYDCGECSVDFNFDLDAQDQAIAATRRRIRTQVMRNSLKWTLAVTGITSLIALWLEPGGTGAVQGVVDARVPPPSSDPYGSWRTAAATATPEAASGPLPSRLPDRDLEAGRRDIFTPVTALPPPPPPSPPAAPPPPPAPPPSPPQMNWRALGSMVTPDGQRLVWLAKGSDEITVKPGTTLDDGYVVQSIDDHAVVLLYPPLGTTARLGLPQAQAGNP
jgi:hypothetical protein